MGLVHCPFCEKETLTSDGVCQFCLKALKRPWYQRKLRRNEAYGVLLLVLGISLFGYLKPVGMLLIAVGIVVGASWIVRSRVR